MSGFFREIPFPDQPPLERPEQEQRAARDTTRGRGLLLAMSFGLAFALLGWRMGALALVPQEDAQRTAPAAGTPDRAQITDRHGRVMSSTLPTWEVALRPRMTAKAGGLSPDDLTALQGIFPDLDRNNLRYLINSGKRAFTYVERRASPRQWKQARDLGIIGMEAIPRSDRVFPAGRVAAHVLGGVDVDNKGISGIEKGLQSRLTDVRVSDTPIALSLDMRVQNALHLTMSEAVAEFAALGAAGLVMDVRTGEMLAMVSLPDFDPNERPPLPEAGTDPALSPLFNRVSQGIYELGSVFKLVTASAALDAGVADLDTMLDARRPIRRGGFTISDFLGKGRMMSLEEVIRYSSNIGAVRIADRLGVERHKAFLEKLGLDSKVPLAELPAPERSAGQLPYKWRSSNAATVAYGHGLAVTPLHIATAIASLANYGCKVTPTLLKRERKPTCERVISRETSGKLRALMRVVGKHSSGRSANIAGYEIGGKTGTAYKIKPGGYDFDKRFNTFIALWPTTEPQYLLLLSLDDPKLLDGSGKLPLAGRTAAPAAGRAIERIAPLLGLAPTDRFRPTGQFVDEVTEGGELPISLPPLEPVD